ncbi:hypothetical protein [Novosphingobium beihaiensis]|uniref:Oligosaccharide repeat unit polymerase n=1 Tax=Novosphingobium beihaiensis TaxID=2930389 RepID=A0ABT0BW86_9SPHN|nr:hypothetical protein [Novosphingobium beihaiensis]MCJ2189277.1 hypothetical protein [Novosphingobium beihaiensis]
MALLSLAIIIASLLPIRTYGISHSVGVFFIFICFYWSFNSLVLKSVFFQPLDSFLYSPTLSYLIVFLAILGASLGALGTSILLPYFSPPRWQKVPAGALAPISIVSLFIGLSSMIVAKMGVVGEAASVFLAAFLLLALISELARVMIINKSKKGMSIWAAVLVIILVILSISHNTKFLLFAAPLSYVVTIFSFKGRFRVSHFVLGAGAIIFLSSVAFPAITYIARGKRDISTPVELIAYTTDAMVKLATGDKGIRQQLEAREARSLRAAGLFRYDVPYTRQFPLFFERFVLVPYVDAVARVFSVKGPFAGTSFVTSQITDVLPSFLNPNKKEIYSGNVIVSQLGLQDPNFEGYPTIGWPAEAFYANGLLFTIASSFVLFLIFTGFLAIFVGRMEWNIFAIYICVRYFHLLSSGVFGSYIFFMLRQLPVDILLFILIKSVSSAFLRHKPHKIVGSQAT